MASKSTSLEHRLQETIAAYLQALTAGQEPDREQLVAAHADLADELRAFFADHDRMTQAAAPVRDALVHATPAEAFPQTFGDYELLEELGRGGMGVVYKARQISLHRIIALKRIRAGQLASAEEVVRFRREAEAAAALDHPHIVPIYEVGAFDGQHYFTMKLIEGGNLSAHLPRFQTAKQTAELMIKIARAVHHAHQRGILHRDLKPGNILVDADGTPHVSDFGLAQPIEKEAKLTQSGAIVGTAEYMAPEQARGEKGLTTAADVYGLGAILYVLLTGRPPFQGDYNWETLKKVVEEEPVPPRSLNRKANRDLETICLRCLEKQPTKRYPSADALADDLQHWLDGKPIANRRWGLAKRVGKWARRRPALAALLFVSVVSAALVLGGGSVLLGQLWDALGVATKQGEQLATQKTALENQTRELTEKSEALAATLERSRGHLCTSQLLRVDATYKSDPKQALELLHDYEACPLHARDAAWRFLERSCRRRLLSTRVGTAESLSNCRNHTPAADGKFCALVRLAEGNKTVVMDLVSGQVETEVKDKIEGELTADGKIAWRFHPAVEPRLLPADVSLRQHDLQTGQTRDVKIELAGRGKFKNIGLQFHMVMSPDGKAFADTCALGAWLFATGTGKQLAEILPAEKGSINATAFSPNGQMFAVSGQVRGHGNGVLLLESATGKEIRFIEHESLVWIGHLRFSHDGQTLALVQALPNPRRIEVCLFDVAQGKVRVCFRQNAAGNPPPLSAFRRDDQLFAVASEDGLQIWDVRRGEKLRSIPIPLQTLHSLTFSSDGARVVLSATDWSRRQEVSAWDPAGLKSHVIPVTGVIWGTLGLDNRLLAVAGQDVRSWDPDAAGPLATFPAPGIGRELNWGQRGRRDLERYAPVQPGELSDEHNGVFFSADGRYIAIRARKELRVFQIETSVQSLRIPETCWYPIFFPDGKRLACLGPPGALVVGDLNEMGFNPQMWDLETGKSMDWPRDLKAKEFWTKPGDRLRAEVDWTAKVVHIRDAETGAKRSSFALTGKEPQFIFSRDGRRVLVASRESVGVQRALELREAATGRLIHRQTDDDPTNSLLLAVSPDLQTLVERRRTDLTLLLRDLSTGRLRAILSSHGGDSDGAGATFNEAGTLLATWDEAGNVRVWDMRPPLEHARFAGAGAAFSHDGTRMLVSGDHDLHHGTKPFQLIDLASGQIVRTAESSKDLLANRDHFPVMPAKVLQPSGERISTPNPWLLFSRDGKAGVQVRLERDGWQLKNIIVSDLLADKLIATLPAQGHDPHWFAQNPHPLAAISDDGRQLAVQMSGWHTRVADLVHGKWIATIELNKDKVAQAPDCLTFSSDSKLLAIGTWETLEFYDPSSGKLHKQIPVQPTLRSLALSRDGKVAATGGAVVQLWDFASGKNLGALPEQPGLAVSLAFSPNSRFLAVGYRLDNSRREVVVWDIAPLPLRNEANRP